PRQRLHHGQAEAFVERREEHAASAGDQQIEHPPRKIVELADPRRARKALGRRHAEQAQFVLGAPGPAADDDERRRDFARQIGLDQPADILLGLDRAEIEEIALSLEVEQRAQAPGKVRAGDLRHRIDRLIAIDDPPGIGAEHVDD
ncbi:hypothetical protein QT22_00490, partial [Staphylococcus aureus]